MASDYITLHISRSLEEKIKAAARAQGKPMTRVFDETLTALGVPPWDEGCRKVAPPPKAQHFEAGYDVSFKTTNAAVVASLDATISNALAAEPKTLDDVARTKLTEHQRLVEGLPRTCRRCLSTCPGHHLYCSKCGLARWDYSQPESPTAKHRAQVVRDEVDVDLRKEATIAAMVRTLRCLNLDEVEVVDQVLTRIAKGRDSHGALNLTTDPRDWDDEAAAEVLDLMAYRSMIAINKRRARLAEIEAQG